MFSSEQTFIIDGDNDKNLEKAIQLIFDISREKVESFYEDSKGLVFCSDKEDGIGYPFEPTIPLPEANCIIQVYAPASFCHLPANVLSKLSGRTSI